MTRPRKRGARAQAVSCWCGNTVSGSSGRAFVAANPEKLYQLWVPGDKKIAQLELSMVLFALVARPQEFRHRRGVWYLDNTAALMALIRGRSDNPDLARMSQLIHLCLFVYQCWVYWEWVPSKSNWSDAITPLPN